MFCPLGQNELDINECDAQIPHIIKNLRSPNEVRVNNRLTAVIEDTLIIITTTLIGSLVMPVSAAETQKKNQSYYNSLSDNEVYVEYKAY